MESWLWLTNWRAGQRTDENEDLLSKAELLKLCVARAAARCVAKNMNIYNDIHYLSNKIITALSIAERHNLTLAFGQKGRTVRGRARASCAVESPHSARSDMTEIKISPPAYYCNKQFLMIRIGHLRLFIFKQLKFWYSHERVPCMWTPFFRWVAAEKRTNNRTADNIQSETRIYPTVFADVIILITRLYYNTTRRCHKYRTKYIQYMPTAIH